MNVFGKALVIASLGILLVSCERDPKKPGWEFLPDMTRSVPYDAFAPNPNTKTGKTLQSPPVGTIPRGYMPFPYKNTPEDAELAGTELKIPIPLTPEVLARGKIVYENFCLICHGVTGQGDGPLIPKYPNPPSFTSKNVKKIRPGRLYHTITYGVGEMGSYASQIEPKDRWKLVHYLQTLQGVSVKEELPNTQITPAQENEIPETQQSPETQKSPETQEAAKEDVTHES